MLVRLPMRWALLGSGWVLLMARGARALWADSRGALAAWSPEGYDALPSSVTGGGGGGRTSAPYDGAGVPRVAELPLLAYDDFLLALRTALSSS